MWSSPGIQRPPFEPLGEATLPHLMIKTALQLALTSVKRVGDLQAHFLYTECLEFGPGDSHVVLRPQLGYMPKVPTTPFRNQVVNSHSLPIGEEDPTPSVLCPVCTHTTLGVLSSTGLLIQLRRSQNHLALVQFTSLADICRAGGLAMPNTFVRF